MKRKAHKNIRREASAIVRIYLLLRIVADLFGVD